MVITGFALIPKAFEELYEDRMSEMIVYDHPKSGALHFRNYRRCIAELSTGINWIYGANGQGKTNLVEALYYLCNLESFRTRKTPHPFRRKVLRQSLRLR
ncbi:MAG: hypothetical protein Ct9H300mP28_17120 [Pseudomonadota bacterium]|nr:MAG: hypothetical protein Ct9H300mP28_17120 [Pseudomonadota bacterium]